MEMTINPRPEQFPLMREAAEKVAILSGIMPPALKIEDVEANSEQLYITADPAQDALTALLAGDVEATRKHLWEMTLEGARHRQAEERARDSIIKKAKEAVLVEDFPVLLDYLNTNLPAARAGFNQNAKTLNENWALPADEQAPAFDSAISLAITGVELLDLLRMRFEYQLPKDTHAFTAGAMRPPFDYSAANMIDTRPAHSKLIDCMNERPKPGQTVKLHWKSERELEAERKAYEAMSRAVGDDIEQDIPVYEYWLSKKK